MYKVHANLNPLLKKGTAGHRFNSEQLEWLSWIITLDFRRSPSVAVALDKFLKQFKAAGKLSDWVKTEAPDLHKTVEKDLTIGREGKPDYKLGEHILVRSYLVAAVCDYMEKEYVIGSGRVFALMPPALNELVGIRSLRAASVFALTGDPASVERQVASIRGVFGLSLEQSWAVLALFQTDALIRDSVPTQSLFVQHFVTEFFLDQLAFGQDNNVPRWRPESATSESHPVDFGVSGATNWLSSATQAAVDDESTGLTKSVGEWLETLAANGASTFIEWVNDSAEMKETVAQRWDQWKKHATAALVEMYEQSSEQESVPMAPAASPFLDDAWNMVLNGESLQEDETTKARVKELKSFRNKSPVQDAVMWIFKNPEAMLTPKSGAAPFVGKIGKTNFVKLIYLAASRLRRQGVTGSIKPEWVTAQAVLETGWGKHMPGPVVLVPKGADEFVRIERSSFNPFGIKKGSRWDGPISVSQTKEFTDGEFETISDSFRAYPSIENAVADLFEVLDQTRYEGVMAARSIEEYGEILQKGGYATDPYYASKLAEVARGRTFRNLITEVFQQDVADALDNNSVAIA